MSDTSSTSAHTLEFFFDYSCPYAYLASTQVEALSERIGASLVWRPMLLGGVFKARGTPQHLSTTLSPAKARHNDLDMRRWADFFRVPLEVPSAHPMRTVEALRATLATGVDPRVVHAFFRAYWVEGRDVSLLSTVREVLTEAELDADDILERVQHDSSLKEELRRRTDEAIEHGIFGAPSFVLDGKELFWGQDRMELLAFFANDAVRTASTEDAPRATGRTLEVYWDFSSPFSYLGCTQAEALAARTGATLVWRPMLLGGLFRAIGQVDVPIDSFSEAKRQYFRKDLERWAVRWNVPFRHPSRFPMNTVTALRAYLALSGPSRDAFRERTFRAYWADDRDISDPATLRELLTDAGADPDAVLARIASPEIKQQLIDATRSAADAGVFGAPTWVVDGRELFWGQDRIPLIERALLQSSG